MIEIISCHIEKTAGDTFRNILKQAYPGAVVSDYLFDDNNFPDISFDTKVIHGHFPLSKYRVLAKNSKFICWLRDPVDRLVSHYFFLRGLAKEEDLVANGIQSAIDNGTFGLDMSFKDYALCKDNINFYHEAYFEGVKLSEFFFVGIYEFFNDECSSLSMLLNWPPFMIPYFNSTKDVVKKYSALDNEYDNFKLEPKLREEIKIAHRDDYLLYNEALKLREERLKVQKIN